MQRTAVLIVAAVTLVRIVAGFSLPPTPDEAYYWAWSMHPALGYVDHPPMVAWFIAAGSWLGKDPAALRLWFIISLGAAAVLLGQTATLISGTPRAGAIAAIAFSLIPETKMMIGEALPDPPYLLFWALVLFFAVRYIQQRSRIDGLLLGLAMGCCVLSRFFGFAVICGVIATAMWGREQAKRLRGALPIALPVAFVVYLPFVIWDAAHGWQNFNFTFHRPAIGGVNAAHLEVLSSVRYWVFAIVFWIAGYYVAIRPRFDLLAWTALPFTVALALLALLGPGNSYWILGPYASLCVGAGIAIARARVQWQRALAVIAGILAGISAASVLFSVLPESAQARVIHASAGAAGGLASTAYAYAPLARDAQRIAQARHARIVSDHFEIVGELYYYGVRAQMIGPEPQTIGWNAFGDIASAAASAQNVLVIGLSPDVAELLPNARCARASTLRYTYGGAMVGSFFTDVCSMPAAHTAAANQNR